MIVSQLDLQLPMPSVPIATKSCEFESCSWRSVLDTTLYVIKFVNDLLWFSPGTPVSSTDRCDITEILLKVALNTITLFFRCLRNF